MQCSIAPMRGEEAGADVLFLEAMTTMEQLEEAPKLFEKPLLYNMASSG